MTRYQEYKEIVKKINELKESSKSISKTLFEAENEAYKKCEDLYDKWIKTRDNLVDQVYIDLKPLLNTQDAIRNEIKDLEFKLRSLASYCDHKDENGLSTLQNYVPFGCDQEDVGCVIECEICKKRYFEE